MYWGEDQADYSSDLLFKYFADVSAENVIWRAVPAEFGGEGDFGKWEHHFVYWIVLSTGEVGFVAILPGRMHQIEQIRGVVNSQMQSLQRI